MKWIKKFDEADAWAGSAYAYVNPEVRNGINKFNINRRKILSFVCDECGVNFESYSIDSNRCPICDSDIYSISDSTC